MSNDAAIQLTESMASLRHCCSKDDYAELLELLSPYELIGFAGFVETLAPETCKDIVGLVAGYARAKNGDEGAGKQADKPAKQAAA